LIGCKYARCDPNRYNTCFPAGLHILRGITKMDYPSVAAKIKLLLSPLDSNLHQIRPIDMVGTKSANFEKMVDFD